MWTLTGALPTTPKEPIGAPIAQVKGTRTGMAPIAQLVDTLPPEVTGLDQATTVLPIPIPAPIAGKTTIDLSTAEDEFDEIDVVQVGGVTYRPAQDITNPQPGEFTFDPYTLILVIVEQPTNPLPVGMSPKVKGKTKNSGVLQTDRIPPPYPSWLFLVPATGELSWSRNFESHPSGSLKLETDRRFAQDVREVFQIGTELPIYDILLRVASIDEEIVPLSDCPEGRYAFSIALEGCWQYYANEPAFYRDQPRTTGIIDSEKGEPDPECEIGGGNVSQISTALNGMTLEQRKNTLKTTVKRLAEQVGASFDGPEMPVYYPKDTERSATTSWFSEAQSRVRQHKSFLFLSSSKAVEVRPLSSGQTWRYSEANLSNVRHSYQGKGKPRKFSPRKLLPPTPKASEFGNITPTTPTFSQSPEDMSTFPKAEYKATPLEGKFMDILEQNRSEEDTRGEAPALSEPRWKRIAPVRREITSGDNNPSQPPKGLKYIKTMDLVHTKSGPKKQVETTITEDGHPIRSIREIWGLSYHGFDVVIPSTGQILALAEDWWKIVERHITDYIYDAKTGYLIRTRLSGFTEKQLQGERTPQGVNSDQPETLELYNSPDPIDQYYLKLYLMTRLAIRGGKQCKLQSYRLYYPTSSLDKPPYEEYKVCNPDGTSRIEYKIDPNWVEPMFEVESLEEVDSFYWLAHPDSIEGDRKPPYTVGDESSNRRRLQLIPANTPTGDDLVGVVDGNDRFLEYSWNNSATGNQFREIAVDGQFNENDGRPSPATRKPTTYEKVEPEKQDRLLLKFTTGTRPYKYVLTTGDYSATEATNDGSVSYPHAVTKQQALDAAETDLLIRDMRENLQTSVTVPFNGKICEGDYFEFYCLGTRYKRRILSVSQQLVFSGELNGKTFVTSPGTQLSCGARRSLEDFNLKLSKVYLPKPPKQPEESEQAEQKGLELGVSGILEMGSISENTQTRRNFIAMNPVNPEEDPGDPTPST